MERGRSFKSGRGRRGYDNAAKIMSAKIAGYRAHEMDEYLDFTEKERKEADDIGDE